MTIKLTEEESSRFARVCDCALKNLHLGGNNIFEDVAFVHAKLLQARVDEASNKATYATTPPADPPAGA